MPAQQQIALPKPLAWDQRFPDIDYSAQVFRDHAHSTGIVTPCCALQLSPNAGSACQDRRAVLLRRLEAHFAGAGRPTLERLTVRHGEMGVVVDYAALRGHCADSDLAVATEMNPADALACIAGAVHEVGSAVRDLSSASGCSEPSCPAVQSARVHSVRMCSDMCSPKAWHS